VASRILQPILENETSPSNTLAEFYRFAVLLTGQIARAEQVMADTLTQAEGALAQIRSERARRAWFVAQIRERCLNGESGAAPAPRLLREMEEAIQPVKVLEIEAYLVAQRFSQLPEPERSALALFYLDSFTNEDIAKLLKLNPHDLGDTLGRARTHLEGLLRGSRSAP
jgi:DNA-directed RNA polymerase specialized sigma24 family protein